MAFKLDHVAVAVSDLEEALERFERQLGAKCERVEEVPTERAKVAFFDLGGSHLELVSPTDPEAPIARSIAKRGEGLHHICLEVADIERTLAAVQAAGLVAVNQAPVPGAGGTRVAFLHPKSLNGVLVELVEKPAKK